MGDLFSDSGSCDRCGHKMGAYGPALCTKCENEVSKKIEKKKDVKTKVAFRYADDWVGLYVNDKLVYESHDLSIAAFVDILSSRIDLAFDFSTDNVVEKVVATGRLPDSLAECDRLNRIHREYEEAEDLERAEYERLRMKYGDD